MASLNCTLTLSSNQKVIYTAVNGNRVEAEIVLDDLTKRLIERFNHWVGVGLDHCDREDLELLGQVLYRVLLPTGEGADQKKPNLRQQIENDYALFLKHRTGNDRFRVTLELHKEANELAKYPWEFLFMSSGDGGFFLAGEKTDLILTRFFPKVPPEINVKTEEPLRILVVFSHPRELGDIKSRVTAEVINDIKSLDSFDHIEVRVEDNPTHNSLCELLNGIEAPEDAAKEPAKRKRFMPDIFHFIGHGEPGKLALIRNEADINAEE